ncbi:MAG: lysine 2,3-aminomutase, partial [Paracoccaceae bacterium]
MEDSFPLRPALTIADLVADGLAQATDSAVLERVAQDFRLRLTPQMRAASSRSDGVARQFVPSAAELIQRPEDRLDPIGDDAHA